MIQDHIYRSRDRLESILVAASDRPGPPRHVPHTLLIDLEGLMQASDITVCHCSPRKCQAREATSEAGWILGASRSLKGE